jgi:hypothetical protein
MQDDHQPRTRRLELHVTEKYHAKAQSRNGKRRRANHELSGFFCAFARLIIATDGHRCTQIRIKQERTEAVLNTLFSPLSPVRACAEEPRIARMRADKEIIWNRATVRRQSRNLNLCGLAPLRD